MSFQPRPAPAYHSPSKAVRASFSRRSGRLNSLFAQPVRSNPAASLYLSLLLRIWPRLESTRPQKLNPIPRQQSDLGQLANNCCIAPVREETTTSKVSVPLAGIVLQASMCAPETRAQAAWLPPTSTASMLIYFILCSVFHKGNVENIHRRRNPNRTIESGVGHQENDFSRSQSKGRLPWKVQQVDNVGVVCMQAKGCVLIPISLGYDNIDSPAARRGESGSTAGFVCDCFEEELAGALRYGKLDGITPGSVRGLALGSSSAGCSRAVARHRTSSTRGHIDHRRARTDQSRPRPDDR